MSSHARGRHARRTIRHPLPTALAVAIGLVLITASAAVGRPVKSWSLAYDAKAHGADVATATALSPDGSTLYVAGRTAGTGTNTFDYLTMALDPATGARRWVARYDGPAATDDEATAITVAADGSQVFVTGLSTGTSGGQDYATAAYDATTGAQAWVARYEGPGGGPDIPADVAASPDGTTVVVTGKSYGSSYDVATIAYDAVAGTPKWTSRYDGPGHGTDQATSVVVRADNTAFVFGDSQGLSTSIDLATIGYGTDGSQLWAARYLGVGYDGACPTSCLGISPDGSRVFATGQSFGMGTAYDVLTVAYDTATGALAWQARYDGPTGGFDFGTDLAVLPDGSGVVVTGGSAPFGTALDDVVTIRYATSDGTQRWATTTDGPSHGDDVANAIAVSPDGASVVIAGFSHNDGSNTATGRDIGVWRFAAGTGQRQWAVRLDGPGHAEDQGTAVAMGTATYAVGWITGRGATADVWAAAISG